MLRSCRGLQGYWIGATDGRIGEVTDFYFDDLHWVIRYLVADTARWREEQSVLISTGSLRSVEWEAGILHTHLSKEQIRNSPSIGAHEPPDREKEFELARHFSWPTWWEGAGLQTSPAHVSTAVLDAGNAHLHSMHALIGYTVMAQEEAAGELDDFLLDDADWTVRYLVVDVGSWWHGEKVLIAPKWLERLDWAHQTAHMAATRTLIRTAPRFNPSELVTREYEARLHEHYGRPAYWPRS